MKSRLHTNRGGVQVEAQAFFSAADPGTDLVPIVTSDTTDYAIPYRAIRCRPDGVAGALKINTLDGNTRTTYIAVGETLLVGVARVWTAGTAATNLEGIV